MFRFHRTADMLSDVSRLLAFAADELRDCARAASVADERACAAIDQADMLQRQLDRLLGQGPKPGPEAAPAPGDAPDPDDAPEGLPGGQPEVVSTWRVPVEATPAADVPPLDVPAPARTRGRRRKGEGEAPASASGQAPDAATEAEAVEQVAQVLGDAPVPAPAPSASRDVSADLFGPAPGAAPAASDDDFPPL